MTKKGKSKKPQKEQKSDDSGVVVTDIVNTYIDEKLQTIAQLHSQNERLQQKLNQLEEELFIKNTQIQGFLETVESMSNQVMKLTERNFELEQQSEKRLVVPKGFRPPIDENLIQEIQTFAMSLLNEKVVNFYKTIAKRFGISTGSAYKYCKHIKNPERKKEDNSND